MGPEIVPPLQVLLAPTRARVPLPLTVPLLRSRCDADVGPFSLSATLASFRTEVLGSEPWARYVRSA